MRDCKEVNYNPSDTDRFLTLVASVADKYKHRLLDGLAAKDIASIFDRLDVLVKQESILSSASSSPQPPAQQGQMAGVADHRRRRGLQGETKSKSRPNRFPTDKKGEMLPDFDKAIPMRFVLTWKLKGNRRVPKARLVVMGHRDSTVIETFSGTPDPGLVRAAIIYALSNSFACTKSDVSTAFLQAPMDMGKKVYVKLPTKIPAVMTEEIPKYMPRAIASANNALYGLK
uniref:Reverse transcriptase Ty1/copia-type domain-containing protein n=1 Tax=Chromera velia CCMP2878 TaxID=1169474 RepID=A0A0G4HE43_9ALVE|eukprot:Cvel_972.t1-p1 / transcript=Cvel_972.t1 / gene=Cvel_972 / organism=Chromera_velia_CCMP2878 / gene_product=hypothetical protein / transcript_product=hypothetical protein / location=Cvel_scaffold31:114176-117037(+) / protein_length=228 / sequence_SO=supercontig / SO=protein_coding / is_pseudo=false